MQIDPGLNSIQPPIQRGFNARTPGLTGVESNNSFRILVEGQGVGYHSSNVNENVNLRPYDHAGSGSP